MFGTLILTMRFLTQRFLTMRSRIMQPLIMQLLIMQLLIMQSGHLRSRCRPLTTACFLLFLAVGSAAPGFSLSRTQQIQSGAALYTSKGCAYCHGKQAQGTAKGPALTHLGWWRWRGSRIARQIQNGGAKMPAFGDSLQPDEVADLVVWLRSHPHFPPASANPR